MTANLSSIDKQIKQMDALQDRTNKLISLVGRKDPSLNKASGGSAWCVIYSKQVGQDDRGMFWNVEKIIK